MIKPTTHNTKKAEIYQKPDSKKKPAQNEDSARPNGPTNQIDSEDDSADTSFEFLNSTPRHMSKRDRAAAERLSKRDYNYEHKDERGYYKKNHNSSKCIGVFGLDRDTTERELERRFKKFGEINGCVLIWNHKTNRSKGFGFVTYDDVEAAEMAVEEMNGTIIEGSKVRV